MPIQRTIMIDDDGSGTTGTIINNDWKQEFYNQIDAVIGNVWLPYTPVWSALSGPAPAIGNGVLAGRYVRTGPTVHFLLSLLMGSTTTYGDPGNIWTLGLPFNILPPAAMTPPMAFSASCTNAAGSGFPPAVAYGLNQFQFYLVNAAGGLVGATTPFTWAANAQLTVRGTYEAT